MKLVFSVREDSVSHKETFSPPPCAFATPHPLKKVPGFCFLWCPHVLAPQYCASNTALPSHPSLSGGLGAAARLPWQHQGTHELCSRETTPCLPLY